ncbi:MAG: MarR family transcriptional regulator [Brevundimonas sp.]|nr:MAG: MarR family transcriptional regulator [Brevundimonas sp.]
MVKTIKVGSAGLLARSPSHLLHRAVQLSLEIHGEEAGPDGLTQRQFAVLEVVGGYPGLSQTDLVRLTGIDRSTLADLVARMATKGLLDRERSTLDARAMVVRLSEAGKLALETARPQVVAADARLLALLPKSRRDVFIGLLTELARTADRKPDEQKAEARAAKKAERDARKAARKAEKQATKTAAKADKAAPSKSAKTAKAAKATKGKATKKSKAG